MRLCTEIVDLIRLDFLDNMNERRRVGQITIVEDELRIGVVRILVDIVNPGRIEKRAATLDAMNFVTFSQKKLGEVSAILTRDSCDEGFFQFWHTPFTHCGMPLR